MVKLVIISIFYYYSSKNSTNLPKSSCNWFLPENKDRQEVFEHFLNGF